MNERIEKWFAARGWRPFDFQRETWDAYLAGSSGLVHAPTGIGKTYAVWFGPVAEYLREVGEAPRDRVGRPRRDATEPIRVLWITPLRALANDTVASLREPVDALGLPWSVELRTGDTSSALRQRQRERFPTALVTTPESLSLQLSHAQTREKLRSLRCVIVDEWHELLGTKRGVQTEHALARLRAWQPDLRTWGLSATIGNLEEACATLLGSARPANARLIVGRQFKRVEIESLIPEDVERFPWAGHMTTRMLPAVVARLEQARSTLCFTNTRSQAEIWYRALLAAKPEWSDQIALHHGSIDRALRQQAEERLRSGTLRCVICTASLDLGVDFSPVDQVIQIGSPKGVARLLQRAGRSGHQPGAVSRVWCVPTHAFELVEVAAARAALHAGQIEARLPLDKPLDVLAQHVVTIACAGGFDPAALYDEIRRTHAYRNLHAEEWRWVLDFATRGGATLAAYPEYRRLTLAPSGFTAPEQRVVRRHRMSIGTITSDTALSVRFVRGGFLGTVEESFVGKLRPGDRFYFAGRLLELVRVREMVAQVRLARGKQGAVPRWMGGRFPLSTQLGAAVRAQLAGGADVADGAELQAVAPLLRLQAAWSALPAPDELLIETARTREGVHWFAYPFEGRLVHEGLAALWARRLSAARPLTVSFSANDYGVELTLAEPLPLAETDWRRLLATDDLLEDLLTCVNETELARRQFRDIARIAGLVFPGYPGSGKTNRQLQASSDLFYDVFRDFDPDNLLLEQARREVVEAQLEYRRLSDALGRLHGARLVIRSCRRLTPLAFPLWAERLRAQAISTEAWTQRVERMVVELERAATGNCTRTAAS